MSEAERLEELWSGQFGAEYAARNGPADRAIVWGSLLENRNISTVLEVGCGGGNNLFSIECNGVSPTGVYGIDIGENALILAAKQYASFNRLYGKARDIPFKNKFFDLVFTCGVLIHQPEESLLQVMSEIVRCSRKYVLCMEYFSETREEVPYRDQAGALFRDNYGKRYLDNFNLKLVETGFLAKEQGFDRITYWLMEK